MNHAMVDIETLSTRPDAAVLSIGVAIFNDTGVEWSNGWAISAKHWHGHLEPETIQWWSMQSDAAREFSFKGTYSDLTAAFELKAMLAQANAQEVWANDPDFDIVILKQWWSRLGGCGGGEFPIDHRQHRSYRTLCALAKELTGEDQRNSWKGNYVAHNPIEDAVSQARVVIACKDLLIARASAAVP